MKKRNHTWKKITTAEIRFSPNSQSLAIENLAKNSAIHITENNTGKIKSIFILDTLVKNI